MYRRDRLIALLLVLVLILTLATVFVAIGRLASPGVRTALVIAGTLLVIFNAGSIRAMLKHNREDRTFIYTLDIKHLDEHRLARAARKDPRSEP
jgi:hypothetical protein